MFYLSSTCSPSQASHPSSCSWCAASRPWHFRRGRWHLPWWHVKGLLSPAELTSRSVFCAWRVWPAASSWTSLTFQPWPSRPSHTSVSTCRRLQGPCPAARPFSLAPSNVIVLPQTVGGVLQVPELAHERDPLLGLAIGSGLLLVKGSNQCRLGLHHEDGGGGQLLQLPQT